MDDETARVLITAGIGIAGALLGTYFGYRLRSREARRERQLAAYAEVAGSLVRAANAGAALQSVHLQLGETWRDPAHKATTAPLWSDWSENYQQFETACAIARMVGSSNGRAALEDLHGWFVANVLQAPPHVRSLDDSGGDAKNGPRATGEAALREASKFADAVQVDN